MARFFELPHLLTLLVIVLLVFGASKLPDIARNLGKSAKILKEDLQELKENKTSTAEVTDSSQSPASDSPVTSSQPQGTLSSDSAESGEKSS